MSAGLPRDPVMLLSVVNTKLEIIIRRWMCCVKICRLITRIDR